MSCSEQSTFHGQASDRAWFFSELLFQSVAAKKKTSFEVQAAASGVDLLLNVAKAVPSTGLGRWGGMLGGG